MILYKVLPLACLVASASSFPVVPMLTGVRAPAHDSATWRRRAMSPALYTY